MLANRKHVSVRVFEPGHLVAIRRRPDSQFAILNERISLKGHTPLLEPADNRLDIADFPAQDGVGRWVENPALLRFGSWFDRPSSPAQTGRR